MSVITFQLRAEKLCLLTIIVTKYLVSKESIIISIIYPLSVCKNIHYRSRIRNHLYFISYLKVTLFLFKRLGCKVTYSYSYMVL